jgi:hypothetical protein
MKRTLQVFLALFGVTTILIGLLHVAIGPGAIPGSIPVNATMDSEDRFYATIFVGFGLTVLWCVRGIEDKGMVVIALALALFAGGLARIVSIVAVGLPNTFFIAMTVLELVIPIFIVVMQSRVSKFTLGQPGGAANQP